MTVLETDRLRLRRLTPDDAEFMLRLLNELSFIENIGDRGVRTLDDARAYILKGPVASYERHGFGLWLVEEKDSRAPVGTGGHSHGFAVARRARCDRRQGHRRDDDVGDRRTRSLCLAAGTGR